MNYDHFNRALNKRIRNKRQYQNEMKRQGLIPFEQAEEIAKKVREERHKDYKPTKETERFLHNISKDKNGKVKLSGRQIEYMEKVGVNFKRPEYLGTEGGWK